jgi:hypothetical protein
VIIESNHHDRQHWSCKQIPQQYDYARTCKCKLQKAQLQKNTKPLPVAWLAPTSAASKLHLAEGEVVQSSLGTG